MQTIQPAAGATVSAESSSSAVNWGPIIAGGFAATSLTFILMVLGSGLGLSLASPGSGGGSSVTTLAASTAIWLIVVQWLSSGVGGYLTGRLRTKWSGVHTDETYFRDTAHGFLAWAVATLLIVGVLGSAVTSLVGAGTQAVSSVASSAVTGASSAAGGMAGASGDGPASYFVDALLRPADPTKLAAGTEGDASAAGQISRILVTSAADGKLSDADRDYVSKLVAARTGLPEADAKTRIDGVLAQVEDAKVKAKEAADAARKAAATFALVSALSLVIGAFIASAAAALGGRQRDEDQDRYTPVR